MAVLRACLADQAQAISSDQPASSQACTVEAFAPKFYDSTTVTPPRINETRREESNPKMNRERENVYHDSHQ